MRLIPRAHDSSTHFLRSAYSLVINTVATGVLGVAFWIFAARFFEPEEALVRSFRHALTSRDSVMSAKPERRRST